MTLASSCFSTGNESEIGAAFARFFTVSVLKDFAKLGQSKIASQLAKQYNLLEVFTAHTSMSDFYNDVFDFLTRRYRYEYIYKNAIAEKILLGKHNLNTAFMLMEFQVGNSKADAVVLNGSSHVYEIKTEFDNFVRLERQLNSYRKVFEKITVITSQKLYSSIEREIPSEIGIMVLAEDGYRFKKFPGREAKTNLPNVQSSAIFDCLQRREFTDILWRTNGISLSELPNTQIYSTAKPLFADLAPEIAHAEMVSVLQNRGKTKFLKKYIQASPRSLKAAMLSLKLSKRGYSDLMKVLDSEIGAIFV